MFPGNQLLVLLSEIRTRTLFILKNVKVLYLYTNFCQFSSQKYEKWFQSKIECIKVKNLVFDFWLENSCRNIEFLDVFFIRLSKIESLKLATTCPNVRISDYDSFESFSFYFKYTKISLNIGLIYSEIYFFF